MEDLRSLRQTPFAVAVAVTLIVAIVVFRLPEGFIADLRAGRPFSAAQSGWLTRLLVLAALAQALYVGSAVLRPEKVEAARERDRSLGSATPEEVVGSVGRNAALVPLLTLVYGASNVALTGERGTFWLFLLIAVIQLGWYYRATGEIALWMSLQTRSRFEAPGDTTGQGYTEGGEERRPAADRERMPPPTT